MKLDKYIKVPVCYNKNNWGQANVITSADEYNKLAKFAFSLGSLKLTLNKHLHKDKICRQGAVWIDSSKGVVSSVEFVMIYAASLYRFVYRPSLPTDQPTFTGLDALKLMREECGDILKPYAVKTNEEVQAVKDRMPKVMIKLTSLGELMQDQEIKNVVHIDINSAFPAGVVATHPEFKEFFEKHYALRHADSIHKAVMNFAIGAAQSLKIRGNRYPELARSAITWTNNKLAELTFKLKSQGYSVLGYNTDGIFYKREEGQPLYTDKNEGTKLGQWKTDSVFDRIRFKSAGSYEYEKNGVYHPVVRGYTKLDKIKPRSDWNWGDIYQAKPLATVVKNNQLVEVEIEIDWENI